MRLGDIVSFRRDLLFNGAVQIGWLETDTRLAERAAEHYAFHGPDYHGFSKDTSQADSLQLVDTASFALDILERVTGRKADEPFALAIAGYGTGKSHLGVTLASLLNAPKSPLAGKILDNLRTADRRAGERAREMIDRLEQPFLVVAINGMRDFDLTGEIVRQVLLALKNRGLDPSPLESLRPRFKHAINFTDSFFEPLREEFCAAFGDGCSAEGIVARLKNQDEDAFDLVSKIFEERLGTPIRATGQESLHEFIQVTNDTYCGEGKPFAGLLILFDEFGRYLEFAVERPNIAGRGALQQLFEAVQANADGVFLLCFIQYDLRAYIARVAPELRDDLQRYVTRYDGVRKVRLSTNLETLFANLLEKKEPAVLAQYISALPEPAGKTQSNMRRWLPDLENHAVWNNVGTFEKVIREGCWPLHPLSTWMLYRLASVGKSLQQRSALSHLADAYDIKQDSEPQLGYSMAPIELCNDALIDEFVASERFGQQGASAQAYRSVLSKYENQLTADQIRVLKAILVTGKIGLITVSRGECLEAIAGFSGRPKELASKAISSLESELGAISWNEGMRQYEIVSDAVPRSQFLAYLEGRTSDVPGDTRAQIFSQNFAKWFSRYEGLNTDFGAENEVFTKEWNYEVSFANVGILENQIKLAVRNWIDARGVDEPKGQLIYCYVGAESNLSAVREKARSQLKSCLEQAGFTWAIGAPVAVSLLNDQDGTFGKRVAEYLVLQEMVGTREAQRYANFILDRKTGLEDELSNQFDELRRQRHMEFATGQEIPIGLIASTLTQLFESVYSRCIPFPFDGFSTAAGNAAKDCQLFTRQLFLGHLDRNWISACSVPQRNRAYRVLDQAWGVIDGDGSVRKWPGNPAVRRLFDLLDSWLNPTEEKGQLEPLNLGKALRAMCAPPYGCNLASAGLVLALLVCGRKDGLDFRRQGRSVSVENWLQAALSRTFLDLSVLDDTTLLPISETQQGEWDKLLDAWDRETTLSGKLDWLQKSRGLEQSIPIPRALHFRHENLRMHSEHARDKLNAHYSKLDIAFKKIESGTEKGNMGLLSWGAADLVGVWRTVRAEAGWWTPKQLAEIEQPLAAARIAIQTNFSSWLARQKTDSIVLLAQFLERMERIADNLEVLGFKQEKQALEQNTDKVRQNVEFLHKTHRLKSDVDVLIRSHTVNQSTPMSVLCALQQQIASLENTLVEARQRNVDIVKSDLDAAETQLTGLRRACENQVEELRRRAEDVYNAEIKSIDDVHSLRAEVAALRQLFGGQEANERDFDMVRKQLDCVEVHYRQLDRDNLSDGEFEKVLKESAASTAAEFGEDKPPLDNEVLYEEIGKTIKARRRSEAKEWMQRYVPEITDMSTASADQVLFIKSRLKEPPQVLSPRQMQAVTSVVSACDKRLDELEVDGLVAMYQKLSDASKQAFLRRIGMSG